MIKQFAGLLAVLLISGCAGSYHNINKNGESALGGGFRDTNIADGLYFIISKTNFAPWTNFDAAQKTFDRRAKELCAGDYTVIDTKRDQFEHTQSQGAAKYIISRIEGHVHCKSSELTLEEAKQQLDLTDASSPE